MDNGQTCCDGISVIVITLNEEKNIRACLSCLVQQQYPKENYEIIVVDASRDTTPEIVAEFAEVRLLRCEKGFSRQKNMGWQAARFDVVAFTDADCLFPNEWLQNIAKAMIGTQRAAIGGDAKVPPGSTWFALCVASVGHPAGGSIGFDANVTPGPQGISFIAGCNAVFRKKVIEEVGGFGKNFQDGGEDVDIAKRIRLAGYRLDYIPDLTIFHKPHIPFKHYVKWNIGVGVTKFNLKQPSCGKIFFDPRFPLWPLIAAIAWTYWLISTPLSALLFLLPAWIFYLLILSCFSRPFNLLLKRRREIGISLWSSITMVPFLVLIRQMAIYAGQMKKWFIAQLH